MKEVYSSKIKKGLKSSKIVLLLSILFIIATISSIIWAIDITKMDYPEEGYLNDVIVEQNNATGVYACVNISAIPYVFAEASNNSSKYYFIRDEDYFYIAYLDHSTMTKLSDESIETSPIKICGVTQLITSDVQEIAIEVYNEAMEENVVTNSNFKDYFGGVYLNVVRPVNDNFYAIMLSAFCGIISLLLTCTYIVTIIKNKNFFKNITEQKWNQINNEIEDCNVIYYKKGKVYLTKNYIIEFSKGINTIEYKDIIWMYPHELKHNGITTRKSIVIIDSNFKRHIIASMPSFGKKNKKDFNSIMSFITDKNNKILLGYTKENKDKINELKSKNRG